MASAQLCAILRGLAIVLSFVAVWPAHLATAETVVVPSPADYETIDTIDALQQRIPDRVFHLQEMATNQLHDVHFTEYGADWRQAGAAARSYLLSYHQSAKTAQKAWALVVLKERAVDSWRHLALATVHRGIAKGDYFVDVQTKEVFRILSEEKIAPMPAGN